MSSPPPKLTEWSRARERQPFEAEQHNRLIKFSRGELAAPQTWTADNGSLGLRWAPSVPLLTVGSNAAFNGAVTLGDAPADAVNVLGTMTVTPLATFTGGLTAVGPVTANGAVTLGDAPADAVNVLGTMTVTPLATFTGGLTAVGPVTANGAVTLGDAPADAILVKGTATFQVPLQTTDIAAGAVTQSGLSGNFSGSTTSSSAAAISGSDVVLTTVAGGVVLVWTSLSVSHSVAGSSVFLQVNVDGGAAPVETMLVLPTAAQQLNMLTLWRFTGLTAAAHTFRALWRTSVATATIQGGRLIAFEGKR